MVLHTLNALQGATADTVVALQVRGPVSVAADVAILVGAVAVAILALTLVRSLLRVRRVADEVQRAVRQNIGPVSDRARGISDNVEFITGALRTDVARLTDSVKALTDRLHQASDRMEERIEEFNALMEVVQSEAEDLFIDTAATVRGVRRGVRESTRAIGRAQRGTREYAGGDAPEDDRSRPPAEADAADAPTGGRLRGRSGPADDSVDTAAEAPGDAEGPGDAEAEAEPTRPGTSRP
jgi:uncharacterized protein YoxC